MKELKMNNDPAFELPEQMLSEDGDPMDIERLIASELNEADGDPLAVVPGEGEAIYIGIGSAWQTDKENRSNQIICYSAVVSVGSKEKGYIVYTEGPEKKHRLSLEKFLGHIVHEAKKDGLIAVWPNSIVVFCQFMRGTVVNFSDFWAVKGSTTAVAGTITSIGLKAEPDDMEEADYVE